MLKNDADPLADRPPLSLVPRIDASHQHTSAIGEQQGIAVTSQRRFATPIMAQHDQVLARLHLQAQILQSWNDGLPFFLRRIAIANLLHINQWYGSHACLTPTLLSRPRLIAALSTRRRTRWISRPILPPGKGRTS